MAEPASVRPKTLGYQPALDGIRAVAILVVVFFHVAQVFGISSWGSGGVGGVDVFLVLSGFLITSLLLAEASGRKIHLPHFYARRALRLMPALTTLLVAHAAYTIVTGDPLRAEARGLVVAGTYLTDLWYATGRNMPAGLEHLWSLALEEHFYLLWPPALVVLLRRRDAGRLAVPLVAAALVVAATRVVGWQAGGNARVAAVMLGRADGLLLGCAMGALWTAGRLRRPGPLPAAVAASAVVAVTVGPTSLAFLARGGFLLINVATCIVLAEVLAGGPMDRWLGQPTLAQLGRLSYSLYLWHYPVMVAIRAHLSAPAMIEALVSVVVSVALAQLSLTFVERPFLRLKRRFAHKFPVPAVQPSVA